MTQRRALTATTTSVGRPRHRDVLRALAHRHAGDLRTAGDRDDREVVSAGVGHETEPAVVSDLRPAGPVAHRHRRDQRQVPGIDQRGIVRGPTGETERPAVGGQGQAVVRRLEVPVGDGDAGLHRQIEATVHLPRRHVVARRRRAGSTTARRHAARPALNCHGRNAASRRIGSRIASVSTSATVNWNGKPGVSVSGAALRGPGHAGERPEAAAVEQTAILRHLDVVRIHAGHDVPGDLAGRRRDLVDAVVHHRRDEQAASVRRQRHVIGAAGVQRSLPQQPAGRDVERRHVAQIPARDIERAAIRRHVRVLGEVRLAGPLGSRSCAGLTSMTPRIERDSTSTKATVAASAFATTAISASDGRDWGAAPEGGGRCEKTATAATTHTRTHRMTVSGSAGGRPAGDGSIP